jgi:hypothetical protein
MSKKLNPEAFGLAGAIVSAFGMLIMGIFGNMGLYGNATRMMQQWHMFYNLSAVGIVGGMIEAAIISFVFAYVLAVVYNQLA